MDGVKGTVKSISGRAVAKQVFVIIKEVIFETGF